MTAAERLKTYPGFVYQIGNDYYFLGKWICRPCTDVEITDTHFMYNVCTSAGETENAGYYFKKLRAYSDFALEVPCNPAKVQKEIEMLLASLTEGQMYSLEEQLIEVRRKNG